MRIRWVATVVVAGIGLPPGSAATPEGTLPLDAFGINTQGIQGPSRFGVTDPDEVDNFRDRHLSKIYAEGLRLVRSGVMWNVVEPRRPDLITGEHTYEWGHHRHDEYMVALARNGLTTTKTLFGTPAWARAPGCTFHCAPLPSHEADFGSFAGAVAERYGRGGSFWSEHPELPYLPVTVYEIWNEPNHNFSGTTGCATRPFNFGPRHYARMYRAAYNAIKEIDPQAVVQVSLSSRMQRDPNRPDRCTVHEFLSGMMAEDPDVKIDSVGFHIYARSGEATADRLRTVRLVMDELGLTDSDLEVNEYGWPTNPQTLPRVLTDEERAVEIREATELMSTSNCGVRAVMPHTWITEEGDEDDPEHWFGIANPDVDTDAEVTLKESGEEYTATVRRLQGGPHDVNELCEWRSKP